MNTQIFTCRDFLYYNIINFKVNINISVFFSYMRIK